MFETLTDFMIDAVMFVGVAASFLGLAAIVFVAISGIANLFSRWFFGGDKPYWWEP